MVKQVKWINEPVPKTDKLEKINKGKYIVICMGLLTSLIGLIFLFNSFEVRDKHITIYDGVNTYHPIIKPFELIFCLFGITLMLIGVFTSIIGLVLNNMKGKK